MGRDRVGAVVAAGVRLGGRLLAGGSRTPLLTVAAFGCFVVAGWLLAPALGVAVLGGSLLLLDGLIDDNERTTR